MVLENNNLSGVFKLRGLFRLLRVGILIRKFDAIRKKSAARKKLLTRDVYHVTSPAEIVNEILCEIRDLVQNDDRLIEDINYCIKMISSGKLYETNVLEDEGNETDDKKREAMSWVKSIQGRSKEERKSSVEASVLIYKKINNIDIAKELNLTAVSKEMLKSANSLNFNIFDFKDEVKENEMHVLVSYLMHKHGLFQSCKIDPEVFFKFIKRIQDYYNPNFIEYHNKTHGTDVCQTSYFFLEGCDFKTIGSITDMEMMSIFVSTACHDFEHPGFNNFFMIESKTKWALEYNDKSPLENHHIAATFMVIESKDDYNIFKNLDKPVYKEVRKNMIEIVLGTDAAHHFNEVAKFKSRISAEDFSPSGDDKLMIIKMMVHLADISNPCKPFDLALIWTGLLYDEFFKQGDREAEMGRDKSFLMDRKTINIAGSSVGFAKALVQPAYEALVQVIPKGAI